MSLASFSDAFASRFNTFKELGDNKESCLACRAQCRQWCRHGDLLMDAVTEGLHHQCACTKRNKGPRLQWYALLTHSQSLASLSVKWL